MVVPERTGLTIHMLFLTAVKLRTDASTSSTCARMPRTHLAQRVSCSVLLCRREAILRWCTRTSWWAAKTKSNICGSTVFGMMAASVSGEKGRRERAFYAPIRGNTKPITLTSMRR